ncbi:MAG TPA: 1-deoxy-D-xylulose-5-phosphate reductoisomerase, partial [Ruminococcaceae bacterium]|nr:1-deoxy-D-xylulose-5-phosphate reductoisomerase [Oscillospiraceae bacterium]
MSKIISILGSTGSIGTQSLSVCKNLGYYVNAITANSNTKLLEEQAREFNPRYVAITEEKHYNDLKLRLSDTNIKILCGIDGLCEIAQLKENDILINSVVGMIGLKPTLAAINAKKNIALANKETLVVGGSLVTQA